MRTIAPLILFALAPLSFGADPAAKPKAFSGDVTGLEDRGEGMLYASIWQEGDNYHDGGYVVWEKDSKITLDGKPATKGDVLKAWKVPYPWMRVTLHPRLDRYGASTDAEFVTAVKPKGVKAPQRLAGEDSGLGITGPQSVAEHKMVRLKAVGVPDGGVTNWTVTPAPADTEELADGTFVFTAPAGAYTVTVQALSIADGKLKKSGTVSATVTITGPPQAKAAGQATTENRSSLGVTPVSLGVTGPRLVRKLVCNNGVCQWVDSWE